MALDEYAAYASAQFRKLSNADKWGAVKGALSGNMSALAKSLGVTRKTLYAWKAAYEGTGDKAKPQGSMPRAWGRKSIIDAKRAVSLLPVARLFLKCNSCGGKGITDQGPCASCEGGGKVDRRVFSAGDIVVLLALIAGDRDALDQLPELLREPMSKCIPSTR